MKEIRYNLRTRGVKKFYEQIGENIIALQKLEPPFMKVKKGYGFQGVVLYDQEDDRVQCHICGLWFKHLLSHIKIHKLVSKEYKDRFGLYRKEPLMSLGLRKVFIEQGKKNYNEGKVPLGNINRKERGKDKEWRERKNGSRVMAWKNRYGTCDAQLCFRVKTLADKLRHFPKEKECSFSSSIRRRFGKWSNFFKFYNFHQKLI